VALFTIEMKKFVRLFVGWLVGLVGWLVGWVGWLADKQIA